MSKCKVIDIFKLSWGVVALLDFLEPTTIKLGHKLVSSNGLIWEITGIAKSKSVFSEKYKNKITSAYVWDCTIRPVNQSEFPLPGEVLGLKKE